MMHLTELTDKVYINIKPGLYIAGQETACGKTYLCSMLNNYRKAGYPVTTYTYDDLGRVDIKNELDINKYKLIFIDRYDMYNDVGHSEILDFVANGGTVILDCKEGLALRPKCKVCLVEIIAPKEIEVR